MNAVLQMLWTLPTVQQRYVSDASRLFQSSPPDPAADLPTQVTLSLCAVVSVFTSTSMYITVSVARFVFQSLSFLYPL